MPRRGGRGIGWNKYSAQKARCRAGHEHASRREAARCGELHLLERAGEIGELEIEPQFWFVINGRQVKHRNGRRAGYKADFRYTELATGELVVEEVKGVQVRDWPLRRSIFLALFPDLHLKEIK